MTRQIIGLSGYARTGKDTVAQLLVERGWHQASFAAPLKQALLTLDPTIRATAGLRLSDLITAYGWEKTKDKFPEVRQLLQRMGTDVGRQFFGDNVWVDLALKGLPEGVPVVFSDCRFPNEGDAIRRLGGHVVRVNRHGYGPTNGHVSETALDDYPFDAYIWNTGTLDELRMQVVGTVECGIVPVVRWHE